MADSHSKSFFGQNTGIIVSSSSSSDPFMFIHCFKKKPNGVWEKPSSREGKAIKFSLEEIVMILRVLNHETHKWQCQHIFKGKESSVSFNWEDINYNVLWINVGKYSKRLNLAQTAILRLLLTHFLDEKIIYSTLQKKGNTDRIKKRNQKNQVQSDEINVPLDDQNLPHELNKAKKTPNDTSNLYGSIVGETEKAVLIDFTNKEEWIPKSAINNQYLPQKNVKQKFMINDWILKKLELIL
ncbi:MAG: hypothetical protein KGD68_10835 [Candidatus Lokiarchaeota archaeon]|nr:hypothetical protein [Candidatus Lokiarchaeota archaeon]